MKRILWLLAISFAAFSGLANAGVSVSIGEPGFFGAIDIGNAPPPEVYSQQPVIVAAPSGPPIPPVYLRVPVGTTVTFLNPGAETFANFPNQKLHCATQFFEGLFNPKLSPGQSFSYTFRVKGEYFYNDCTDPRPTCKIVVY